MASAEKLALLIHAVAGLGRAVNDLDELEPGLSDALARWIVHREEQGLEVREPTVEEIRALLPKPPPTA